MGVTLDRARNMASCISSLVRDDSTPERYQPAAPSAIPSARGDEVSLRFSHLARRIDEHRVVYSGEDEQEANDWRDCSEVG